MAKRVEKQSAGADSGQDLRRRWWALIVLCTGVLMIVLDTTIVNVALPSIRLDLGLSETSLVWVVNAYLLTFAGCLLLGGRVGDIYGHRLVFLAGLSLFTAASVACGLATTSPVLVAARAVQGIGGAVVSAISLSLIVDLFSAPADRAKAIGVYGFVCAGGGTVGVLLGGVLTHALSWHWIFLVNLPIGAVVFYFCRTVVPKSRHSAEAGRLDIFGAVTVTGSLMLAVYAIVNGQAVGWRSTATSALLGLAVALMAVFLVIEAKVTAPLMPLALFRKRNVATANVVGVLWAGAMFAWFFVSALYMQRVLNYSALEVGLAFLPANIIMGAFSLGWSARLVVRYGIRAPMVVGLLCAAVGLALFARAPVAARFVADVLPSMSLLGLGAGIAFNPLLVAAMSGVAPSESGLASGVVNTSFMMGGSLGLAILASIAAAHSEAMLRAGMSAPVALTAGYQRAFALGALSAFLAAATGLVLLRAPVDARPPER